MTRRTRINPVATITDTTVVVTTLTGAAIQAAMNSFGGQPGIVALKPSAIYLQTSSADQLILPSNITLLMNGATLKKTGAIGVPQIINSDTTNGNTHISLIGPGVIDGNSSGANGHIVFHKVGYLTLDKLEFKNCPVNAIQIFGDQHQISRYVTLSNLDIYGAAGCGIWLANGQRAVTWTNVKVHDCAGLDVDSNGVTPAAIIDASEQTINSLYAYGNTNTGILIRNVFACTFNNLQATRNGKHGIYVEAMNDSVGSNWLATTNGDATSNTYHDIYFSGTGSPTFAYGTTAAAVIEGIRCGPVVAAAGLGAWVETAHGPETGKEAYGLYIEDAVGSYGGDVRLLNVMAVAGLTGSIRYPATMGNLVVTDGKVLAPSTVSIIPLISPKSQQGFTQAGFVASTIFNAVRHNTAAPAQNDYVEWDIALRAGTYTLDLWYGTGPAYGILTVTLDGTTIATKDAYAASLLGNQGFSFTGVAVPLSGTHTVRITVATKNASSSNYTGYLNLISFTRTGS